MADHARRMSSNASESQASESNKRKRDSTDNGARNDATRGWHHSSGSNGSGQGTESEDALNTTFFTHSGADGSQGSPNQSTEALLQQQLMQHANTLKQNGHGSDGISIAKAALGTYPGSFQIPQPTDVSFASGGSGGDGGSYDNNGGQPHLYNPAAMMATQNTANQVQAAREASGASSKPAVGSEEWHKVRKDNHKEGTVVSFLFSQNSNVLTIFQWSVAGVRTSMKASTSLPR